MKTYQLKFSIAIFILLVTSLFITPAKAQVSVNVNISSQAVWGPVGYDYAEYYYLPEADAFYYVNTGQFIYWNGGQQVFAYSLPPTFSINLYSTYKVVVNDPKPYKNHGYYVSHYAKYKHGGFKQDIIRDSNDEKYYKVKGHPKHGQEKGSKKSAEPKKSQTKSNTQSQPKAQKSGGGQKSQQQSAPKQGGGAKQGGHGGKGH